MFLAFPGAFLLWIFNRKGRSFSDIIHDDPYLNYFLGSISIVLVIIIALIINILFF